MFSSPLPDGEDYRVFFTEYAQRHYIKRFAKDYKGKRWIVTQDSIFQDLKRVHSMQQTQQVDELKGNNNYKLFKYDFAVAQTGISPKASGNRCIVFLDILRHRQDILLIYGKNDLPKNMHENQYILQTIEREYEDFWKLIIEN